jgi:hypothetical protein
VLYVRFHGARAVTTMAATRGRSSTVGSRARRADAGRSPRVCVLQQRS